jgi:hypothetical protein
VIFHSPKTSPTLRRWAVQQEAERQEREEHERLIFQAARAEVAAERGKAPGNPSRLLSSSEPDGSRRLPRPRLPGAKTAGSYISLFERFPRQTVCRCDENVTIGTNGRNPHGE